VRCGNRAEVVVPNVPMIVVAGCLVVGCLVVVRWLLCAGHLMHFAFIYGHWMRVTQRFPSRCLMFWPRQVSGLFTRKPESQGIRKYKRQKYTRNAKRYSLGIARKYFTLSQKGKSFWHLTSTLFPCSFVIFAFMNGLCFLGITGYTKDTAVAVLYFLIC